MVAAAHHALKVLFGAKAQVAVGFLFVAVTLVQAWLWGIHQAPSAAAIFWLSIEALLFAGYAVVATGLGYRATERVEAHVEEASTDISPDCPELGQVAGAARR